MVIELESVKTRISAPAHPSATGIGRVSGLVFFVRVVILEFKCLSYVVIDPAHPHATNLVVYLCFENTVSYQRTFYDS